MNDGLPQDPRTCPEARRKMIEQYMPFVRMVARRFARGIPSHNGLDLEDLVAHGMVGLIHAVDRFEPREGVKFESFAMTRIRGAMIDAVRNLDHLPRTARSRATLIDRTFDRLSRDLGREPARSDVCQAAGLTEREYRDALVAKQWVVVPFESVLPSEGDDSHPMTHDPAADLPEPTATLEHAELLRDVAAAIRSLPERDQQILALHFQDELTLTEIASVLDVSLSRVSQLYRRAIERVRAHPLVGRQAA